MTGVLAMASLVLLAGVPLLHGRTVNERVLWWARDRFLWALGAIGVLAAFAWETWAGFIVLSLLIRWRNPSLLPTLATWAGLGVVWALVPSLDARALMHAWASLGMLLAVVCTYQAVSCWWLGKGGTRRAGGWLISRSIAAASLSLAFPLALAWHPVFAGVIGVGLIATASWLAWIAAGVALVWMHPAAAWLLVPAALVMLWPIVKVARMKNVGPERENTWLDYLPRGTSIDSARLRMRTWKVAAFYLLRWPRWIAGRSAEMQFGRPATGHTDGWRWYATHRLLIGGHFHNDALEFVYDYGALGLAAVVALVWRVGPRLEVSDPVSAAVLAGVIIAGGSWALRLASIGLVWWALVALVAAR